MTKDKRQGWLKDLKVGDEVFIVGIGANSCEETKIGTVSHITPTGRIGVNYTQYSVEGYRKNDLFPTRLKKLTPEAKQEYLLEKQRTSLLIKTRNALKNLNLDKMNTGELQALYDYIKSGND